MLEVLVTAVEALPDDVLAVRGRVGGEPVEAFGWQSALTNHYDPGAYHPEGAVVTPDEGRPEVTADAAGQLRPGAEPRQMTAGEARAYCERLLLEEAGHTQVNVPAVVAEITLDPEPKPPQDAKAEEKP